MCSTGSLKHLQDKLSIHAPAVQSAWDSIMQNSVKINTPLLFHMTCFEQINDIESISQRSGARVHQETSPFHECFLSRVP